MNFPLGVMSSQVSKLFRQTLPNTRTDNVVSRWFNLVSKNKKHHATGQVTLIGAGPGDPELLTLKALRLLHEADVVLYDWLVSRDILALIPQKVEKVFVGKRAGKHSMHQDSICDLMVDNARSGKQVVRLKGGDPAVFGRLGEECRILEQSNIPFAIVPGITAASGMSAYTGIPLTDRRYAQSVRFITAQFKDASTEPDWASIRPTEVGRLTETLVFYMGLSRVALICQRLIAQGVSADTPAMLVAQATTTEQQALVRTLRDLPTAVTCSEVRGPALLVVGDVVGHQHAIDLSLLSKGTYV